MTEARVVSELYMDQDTKTPLGAPPAAPTDVPAPTAAPVKVEQPVVVKSRMADERPDGSVRDTSMEALRPGNELGYRNLDAEKKTPAEEPKPEVANTPQAAPETPQVPPEPPKMYAGKFKSVDELEKSYEEAQKAISRMGQENADFKRQQVAQAAVPPKPVEKTPQQIQTEQQEAQALINEFVANPKAMLDKHYQQATQQTQVALAAQQTAYQWKQNNPDIAEHEFYVTAEAYRLSQTDPELAANPAALINKATDNFRAIAGKIRTEGAKEALTQETRVIPLASTPAPPATTEQPAKAPLTFDDSFEAWMKMAKEAERKTHRGLRR